MTDIPTLIFPDVVALAITEINAQLPPMGFSAEAFNRVPSPRPERFVIVQRAGGTRVTVVTEAAQLAMQAWGQSVHEAEDVAQAVRSVIFSMAHRMIGSVPIYRVDDVGGPAEVTDPLSDQPMATLTLAVHVRGRTGQ
jgi:hypothetical protein